MTEKTRESLFNILGRIDGKDILDAYAGTGALGIEALSRGASSVVAVESARAAQQAIRANVANLGIEQQYKLVPIRVEKWLSKVPEAKFDIIFFMPPYNQISPELLKKVGELVDEGGTLIAEYTHQTSIGEVEGLEKLSERFYGGPILGFFRRAKKV